MMLVLSKTCFVLFHFLVFVSAVKANTLGSDSLFETRFNSALDSSLQLSHFEKSKGIQFDKNLDFQFEYNELVVDGFVDTLELVDRLHSEKCPNYIECSSPYLQVLERQLKSLNAKKPVELTSEFNLPFFPLLFSYKDEVFGLTMTSNTGVVGKFESGDLHYEGGRYHSNSVYTTLSFAHTEMSLDYLKEVYDSGLFSLSLGASVVSKYVEIDVDRVKLGRDVLIDVFHSKDVPASVSSEKLNFDFNASMLFSFKAVKLAFGVKNLFEPAFDFSNICNQYTELYCNELLRTGLSSLSLGRQYYGVLSYQVSPAFTVSYYTDSDHTPSVFNSAVYKGRLELQFETLSRWVPSLLTSLEVDYSDSSKHRYIFGLAFAEYINLMGYYEPSSFKDSSSVSENNYGLRLTVKHAFF